MNLAVNNLSKKFKLAKGIYVNALNDVSFILDKPEIIALVGPNGSGKSTLSTLIFGLQKSTSGTITLNDKPLNRKNKKIFYNEMAITAQDPNLQLFRPSVMEDITFVESLKKDADKDKIIKNAKSILKRLNFPIERIDDSPFNLSAGEKRKVILSAILLKSPSFLIFDEPTAHLDNESKIEFLNLIKKINVKEKKVIIIITHDMSIVRDYTKRTLILNDGNLVYDGGTKDLFTKGNTTLKKNGLILLE